MKTEQKQQREKNRERRENKRKSGKKSLGKKATGVIRASPHRTSNILSSSTISQPPTWTWGPQADIQVHLQAPAQAGDEGPIPAGLCPASPSQASNRSGVRHFTGSLPSKCLSFFSYGAGSLKPVCRQPFCTTNKHCHSIKCYPVQTVAINRPIFSLSASLNYNALLVVQKVCRHTGLRPPTPYKLLISCSPLLNLKQQREQHLLKAHKLG